LKAAAALLVTGGCVGLLLAPFALAQKQSHLPSAKPPPLHTTSEPYYLESFGSFSLMMLRGDFTPAVILGEVLAKHPSTGVGAVSGARGEITIADGKLIVSYGKPGEHPAPTKESASLFAMATANAWQSIDIAHDVAPQAVEDFIAAAAKARGIDPDKSFPFELTGTLTSYVMHVNTAPIDGPHGMGLPMAITSETKGEEIPGQVAGLYVAANLEGIVTHGGERIHAHWLAPDGQWTAHLDHWGIKRGAVLRLPKG
jgi:alpha-acetolactate decarboxylase